MQFSRQFTLHNFIMVMKSRQTPKGEFQSHFFCWVSLAERLHIPDGLKLGSSSPVGHLLTERQGTLGAHCFLGHLVAFQLACFCWCDCSRSSVITPNLCLECVPQSVSGRLLSILEGFHFDPDFPQQTWELLLSAAVKVGGP